MLDTQSLAESFLVLLYFDAMFPTINREEPYICHSLPVLLRRLMKLAILFTSCFVLFVCPCAFAQAAASTYNEKCADESKNLSIRLQSLAKISSSLDSLLGSEKSYAVPLKVIFQVDLSNPALVEKRIQELSKSLEFESVFASLGLSKATACTISDLKASLSEFVKQQETINAKKVEFLKLESEKRSALLNSYETNRKKYSDQNGIENQLISSQTALGVAQQNLNEAESKAGNLAAGDSEEILIAQSSLDKFVVDVETEHIKFVAALKAKSSSLEKIQFDLAEFSKKSFTKFDPKELSESYATISGIWTVAADSILELFRDIKLESEIELPELSIQNAVMEGSKANFKDYSEAYLAAKNRQKTLSQARARMLDDLKIQDFKILNDSGSFRAKILHDCDLVHCDRPRGLSEKNLLMFLREIKIVPLKFLAGGLSKWVEIKSKMNSGLDGWIDLAKQCLLLFILFLIPVFLFKILNWLTKKLDDVKKSLLSKSMIDYRSRTGFATWITRINPFIPSLGMILSIQLARVIIEKTDLSEIASLLFYFQVFFVYRIARMILMIILEVVFASDSVASIKQQKTRIEKTATVIAKLVFIQYVLLHVTDDSVRKAIAYYFFADVIFWINLAVAFYEASKWRTEISSAFKFRFEKFWAKTHTVFESKFGVVTIPFQFVAIVCYDFFRYAVSHLIRLDIVKKVLSEVLRKRLESVEAKTAGGAPPPEYLKEFDYYLAANPEIFIEREGSMVSTTATIIEDWLDDRPTDDLVILVGNRGMGKTTALTHIFNRLKGRCQSYLFSVPPKIVNETELYRWISESLGSTIGSVDDVKLFDSALTEKIVLCVDDIQNLFVGAIGGFDAYKLFLEIISLKTKNIYWCLTVNSRSWSYLKGVFGPEHFYGKVLSLSAWRDFEIQKLILSRHKQTQFKRSFDESIKAYGAGDSLGQQAESQFFRLLWGQSRGNPRSALMYWISAVSSPGPNEIHVGVPSFISSSAVGSMSDDALFILSAIARHECLTHEELRRVTRIEDTVIRKCLKEAANKNLIWMDEVARARISSRAQYVIDYFLIGKNFLYE
jgi:hypothetical protein